jgi:dTMP kinase
MDRMEKEGPAFHRRVRAGYARIAAREARRVRRIEASGDPDAVAEAIWRVVGPWVRRRARR